MKRELLLAEFLSTPWALEPGRLAAASAVLSRWSTGTPAADEALTAVHADQAARETKRAAAAQMSGGGIAVLPMYGIVTQRGNMVDEISGGGSMSTERFGAAMQQLLADNSVGGIVIDIDSPGGSVYGVAELAQTIYDARKVKPIYSIADSLAASAAYWLGSQAEQMFVTPGGEVGSIGVWQAHDDVSKAFDAAGVKRTYISAGKFKVEGNPMGPLDDQALQFMQSRVDDYYSMFTKAVARGRGVPLAQTRDGMGQGRVIGAQQALAEGMVDGAATLPEVIKTMQRAMRESRAANAAAPRLAAARRALELVG